MTVGVFTGGQEAEKEGTGSQASEPGINKEMRVVSEAADLDVSNFDRHQICNYAPLLRNREGFAGRHE